MRQGRAFGIHVLLGSQTLGGAYTLARATLGQMVIRVALQCNEADAYLIMDDNNPAPRLLSRPGEGIYNDAAGAVEGNSPFQVVWLADDERDALARQSPRRSPMQQHVPRAQPDRLRGQRARAISAKTICSAPRSTRPHRAHPPVGRAWLGAPNSIKGPTEAVFQRQSGNHLLIVGQREEAALTMLGLALLALAAQYPRRRGASSYLLHSAPPGSPEAEFIERIARRRPARGDASRAGRRSPRSMNELAAELKARSASGEDAAGAPPIFLLHPRPAALQKAAPGGRLFVFHERRASRRESRRAAQRAHHRRQQPRPAHPRERRHLQQRRTARMSRKALSEFEMRVVFQMSANDSASLIDSPKASNLGLHRALFYNEHEGTLETFRPYAAPDREWLAQTGEKLSARRER